MCKITKWELIFVSAVVLCPLSSYAAGLEEEFRNKIDSVVSNVSSAKAVIKSLQKKVQDLENEKAKFILQLEENKGLIRKLREALSEKSSVVHPEMKDILAKLESKVTQLRKMQAEIVEESRLKDKEIDDLKAKLSKRLSAEGKVIQPVKERIVYKPSPEQSRKIEELKTQLEEKDKEIVRLKDEFSAKETDYAGRVKLARVKKLKDKIRNFSRLVALKNEEINDLKSKKAEEERKLQLKIESLIKALDAKDREIINAKVRIKKMSASNQSRIIKELNDKLKEKDEEIALWKKKLNQQLQGNKSDVEELRQQISKKDERIAYLEGVIKRTIDKIKAFSAVSTFH
ncbi:MAG: hypothetical protein B1H08_00180 [Candidatus Omnitrophica bacterium 4484_171]|nr:MAG: hypothetical protein B1H08_00180 [Candidatus Omnitrophica bacterium 4484_171]